MVTLEIIVAWDGIAVIECDARKDIDVTYVETFPTWWHLIEKLGGIMDWWSCISVHRELPYSLRPGERNSE